MLINVFPYAYITSQTTKLPVADSLSHSHKCTTKYDDGLHKLVRGCNSKCFLILVFLVVDKDHNLGSSWLHDWHEAQANSVWLPAAYIQDGLFELKQIVPVTKQVKPFSHWVGVGVGDALAAAFPSTHWQGQLKSPGDNSRPTRSTQQPGPDQLVVLYVHDIEIEELAAGHKRSNSHRQLMSCPCSQDERILRWNLQFLRMWSETFDHTRCLSASVIKKKKKKLKNVLTIHKLYL